MGVSIPEGAKMVLLQEDRFKTYYNNLKHALREYHQLVRSIVPVMKALLQPHVQAVEQRLRPGWTVLTWTSMNIDGYRKSVQEGLHRLQQVIAKANDIVDNRIVKNLKDITRAVLVDMPKDRTVTLDDFVTMQEFNVRTVTDQLVEKNKEVEMAVEDLISVTVDRQAGATPETMTPAIDELRRHYNGLMYRAILSCTKTSLNVIKQRVCSKVRTGNRMRKSNAFFELDVQLSVPSVRLSPGLDDIQRSINAAAKSVLG
ncbi:unnamed protein product [Sphacelaria rigidula]